MEFSKQYKWYAVYTKSRHEKKVAKFLGEKHIEYYLPLIKTIKQWSDRKKKVEETLIKSYIFVKANNANYFEVLQTPGVVKFITFESKAAPIPDYQIEAIRKSITGELAVEVRSERFKKGQLVEITEGNLKGIKGEIVSLSGKRKLLLRINNIGYSLVVKLPAAYVNLSNESM